MSTKKSRKATRKEEWNKEISEVVGKFAKSQGLSKIDVYMKGRDYDSSVKEVNEGGVNDD